MKYINIIVEGSTEESFVNDVLVKHFSAKNIFVSARKIKTGWDKRNNKPAKGGTSNYLKFRNEIIRWIHSDQNNPQFWYTTMIDLYAFPKDDSSPFTSEIQTISDPYQKINALEAGIAKDINHPQFIPYIQLHEFETFLLVEPDRLITMYPEGKSAIKQLKKDIGTTNPEEIDDGPHSSPSKRIIRYFAEYEGQKAQLGPLVAIDIGLNTLRENCRHFNQWITKLENL